MAQFIKLGTRRINADHIVCVSEVRAPDPKGKGREVRVDLRGAQPEYFTDDESLKALDALMGDEADRPLTREEM